ncbi:DUF3515 domain-containing protein [Microbacterium sp. KUDC0406]|uniref:DUF3515 family protein n=1 Tax=Microbacterium sp. KUDC0406 TaxID=2909588 RepID=UPI001F1BD481|nr:DUF3515 family protein [Microbacterium sp. KUDC0406]UJP11210.1 DUF3515 domain-containing protein [Microbacterium sp. KUDC0406]
MPLRRLAAAVCVLAALVLSGCSSTVSMQPSNDANNPLCAEVTVRLPDAVAGQDRRWTDAQATGAWGDPTTVLLSCGVAVPGPTANLQCITLEGIDWLVDPSKEPWMRMTTYGRDPAVQVFVDTSKVSGDAVLANTGIVSGVQSIPKKSECIAPDAEPKDVE